MSADVNELLKYCLINKANLAKRKAEIIANHFGDVETFNKAIRKDFDGLRFVGGENAVSLNPNELKRIKDLQDSKILDKDLNPNINLTKILASDFLSTQIANINKLAIESLNCNPILIASLKLKTPEEILTYYVFQSAQRSIVTSYGFLVQHLLLYSGENISDAKYYESEHGTKWDILKEINEIKNWIEVKAGPNDLNKTQVISYAEAIEKAEKKGEKAYIGETYGKREMNTITHLHYRNSLPKWEERTLIGRELWDFVAGEENYHKKLMELLFSIGETVLSTSGVIEEIYKKIKELVEIYKSKYKDYKEFLETLW